MVDFAVVKGLSLLDMPSIRGPAFRAIKEGINDYSLADSYASWCCDVVTVPYTSVKPSEGGTRLGNTISDLAI